MPQPKRYASNAQKQAAYRRRTELAKQGDFDTDYLPPLPKVDGIPGTQRWRKAIQLILLLITTVLEEMDNYYNNRSEEWTDREQAEVFQQRKDAVAEVLDAISELADSF